MDSYLAKIHIKTKFVIFNGQALKAIILPPPSRPKGLVVIAFLYEYTKTCHNTFANLHATTLAYYYINIISYYLNIISYYLI